MPLRFVEPEKPSMFGGLASAMQTGFRGTGAEGGINPPMFKFSFGTPQPKPTPQTGLFYTSSFLPPVNQ